MAVGATTVAGDPVPVITMLTPLNQVAPTLLERATLAGRRELVAARHVVQIHHEGQVQVSVLDEPIPAGRSPPAIGAACAVLAREEIAGGGEDRKTLVVAVEARQELSRIRG